MTKAEQKRFSKKWKWPTLAVAGLGIVIYEVVQYRRAQGAQAAALARGDRWSALMGPPGPYVVPMDGVGSAGMLSRTLEAAR